MTPRLHHVAVTVTDMDAQHRLVQRPVRLRRAHSRRALRWLGRLRRGARPPDWSMAVVLNHHPTNAGEAFDPTRTGLDHLGFVMPDRAALEEWETRLSDKGITHSPITDHDWGSSLNFRGPDNMQLQLVAFAGM